MRLAPFSRRGSITTVLAVAVAVSVTLLASFAAADLFSSNVVTLNSSNWKEHVVDNPHMVLVNICREG